MVLTLKTSAWTILLPVLLGAAVGWLVAEDNLPALGLLLVAASFLLLMQTPELSSAILFNGTLIFFYLVCKAGSETSRALTGGFYSLLVIPSLLGGWMLRAKAQHRFRLGSIDILFVSFFFLVFLSYFVFERGSESAYKKIVYAPFLVLGPYWAIRLLSSEDRVIRFFDYCVGVAAILIVPALYELLFNPAFAGASRFSMFLFANARQGQENPILFGITFAILLIILFVRLAEEGSVTPKRLALMIPAAFLLLRSGSRGALLSFVVTIFFYFSVNLFLEGRTRLRWIVLIGLVMAGIWVCLPRSVIGFYRYTLTAKARVEKVSSVYQRFSMYAQAAREFQENPLTGVGTGNSAGGIGYPHNILLEVSAEYGVLGLLLFGTMCYLTLRRAFAFIGYAECSAHKVWGKTSLLLFVYALAEAMVSGYLTNQTHLFMSTALIASLPRPATKLNGGHDV